jgi:hypothetical protein
MKKINYKQELMRLLNLTSDEYDKQYDIYRLRVRNFEKETGKKEKINVSASMYYTFKAQRQGKELSLQKRAILATPAKSLAKKKQAKRPRPRKKMTASEQRSKAYYLLRLKGLIVINPKLNAYINNDDIPWDTRQEKILEYLSKLDSTRKQQLERAQSAKSLDDIDGLFEDYGDAGYELDFDFGA